MRKGSREVKTGKLSSGKWNTYKDSKINSPLVSASTNASYSSLVYKLIWMWKDTSQVLCSFKPSTSQPKGASCAILCVQCGVIGPFQQKRTYFVIFQGKRSYRGTEFVSVASCAWNPIPQKLSSVETLPLLDVSVLLEAETCWEQ